MVEPGVADEASGKDSDVLLKRYTTPSRIDDNSHALLEVALAKHHKCNGGVQNWWAVCLCVFGI